MKTPSWLRSLRDRVSPPLRVFRAPGCSARPGTRWRRNLGCEQLENREVPATFTVTNLLDDANEGSLRWAIGQANAVAGADEIAFGAGLSGAIELTSGQIAITGPVTINGPGSDVIAVDGQYSSRIFMVNGGAGLIAVTISGLTLTRGNSSNIGSSYGGAIWSFANLTIVNSVLNNNTRTGPGETTLFGGGGGAVYSGGGHLTLSGCTITGNSSLGANPNGGGVCLSGGTLTVTASTFSDNSAGTKGAPGGGGGVYCIGWDTGAVIITDSTFSGNSAGWGGGVCYDNVTTNGVLIPRLSVTNSTFSGNSAGLGGGVYVYEVGANILNSTFAGNSASVDQSIPWPYGAGLEAEYFGDWTPSPLVVKNSIFANSISGVDLGYDYFVDSEFGGESIPAVVEHSLVRSSRGLTIANGVDGNIVGRNPLLGPLADNGGPTKTHALRLGSPALNGGNNNELVNLSTDQRGSGFDRVLGGTVDMGALESDFGIPVEEPPPQTTLVAAGTSGGRVRLMEVDGQATRIVQDFRPFASYQGVVNVAFGDTNGDGVKDLIVAARGNLNGRVRVYDGAAAAIDGVEFGDSATWPTFLTPATGLTSPVIANLKAFGVSYRGGLSVAAGDIDGDGFADIIVGTAAGSTGRVLVFSGDDSQARLGKVIVPFGVGYTQGVAVSVGRAGSGSADRVLALQSGTARRIKVYEFGGNIYTQVGTTVVTTATNATAAQLVAFDYDGDGTDEIAVAFKQGKTIRVRVLDGVASEELSNHSHSAVTTGGFVLARIDTNANDRDELILRIDPQDPFQFPVVDPLTGVGIGGFDPFQALTGGVSLAAI